MRIIDWSSDVCSSDLISPRDGLVGRAEADLVGRRWEMAALDAMVERTIGGRGGVVNVVGDRKSVVSGTSVSVRVDLGGRRLLKKNNTNMNLTSIYKHSL